MQGPSGFQSNSLFFPPQISATHKASRCCTPARLKSLFTRADTALTESTLIFSILQFQQSPKLPAPTQEPHPNFLNKTRCPFLISPTPRKELAYLEIQYLKERVHQFSCTLLLQVVPQEPKEFPAFVLHIYIFFHLEDPFKHPIFFLTLPKQPDITSMVYWSEFCGISKANIAV